MRAEPLEKPCSGLGVGQLIGNVVLAGRPFVLVSLRPRALCWDLCKTGRLLRFEIRGICKKESRIPADVHGAMKALDAGDLLEMRVVCCLEYTHAPSSSRNPIEPARGDERCSSSPTDLQLAPL